MFLSLIVKYVNKTVAKVRLRNKTVAKVRAAIDAAKAEVSKIEYELKSEIRRVIAEAKAKL